MSAQRKVKPSQTAIIAAGAVICGLSVVGVLLAVINISVALVVIAFTSSGVFAYRTYLKSSDEKDEVEKLAAKLRESEERFSAAFDHAAGMGLTAANGKWLRVNKSLSHMFACSEDELLETTLHSITHPEDVEWMNEQITNLLRGSISSIQLEQRFMRCDGQTIWALLSIAKVTKTQSKSANLIVQMQDITDRKRAEEKLVHEALHDPLTGLPNRALFINQVRKSLGRWRRRKQGAFALLFLELDAFKSVNDKFGHLVGDQLLVEVGERITSSIRPSDTVARLGGDEFTILLDDLNDRNEAIIALKRLVAKLTAPLTVAGRELVVTASIGVALSGPRYDDADQMLADADSAMYQAKKLGKARYEFFEQSTDAPLERHRQIATDVSSAVEREELLLEYQPIVELETGKIAGFEALLRWKHPTLGLIAPPDFISVAEDTGAILSIGEWVLDQACRQMRDWQKNCPQDPPLYVSVNLSVKQFTQTDLVEQVAVALHNAGLDPASLTLEITESMLMNADSAIRLLSHLHALGVGISIDDFGTGYSSLSYLHRLPIGVLKVDRSFVTSMSQNKESFEIVRTILNLAQSLNLKVVAEGIETEDQLEKLRLLKCGYGQGHFFAKALSVEWAGSMLFANASIDIPLQSSVDIVPYDGKFVA